MVIVLAADLTGFEHGGGLIPGAEHFAETNRICALILIDL